ncbi:VOC family protein [Aquiflexum gelatinilyticum]|uniref:VOC family protein n=1 Tax=Aquiflexum gelatinilyticum TaxID=2961943 RepID=A0A9X2P573_9BACT|nr:VOC family protein [Aquiflexum gelatinilyticum]MCR9016584.1 VOC family protein [Aquiflexum gelatinilyticum]
MKKPAIPFLFFLMTIIAPNLMAQQTKITHIAVYVKELKRSTDFYKNIFEFPEIEEPFKDGLHTWLNIGNNLSLHLIEAPWEPVTINKINHICFSVTDMDLIISNLKKQKVEFEDWPGNKNKINIRPDGIKQIYVQDPDGYWIEINDEY